MDILNRYRESHNSSSSDDDDSDSDNECAVWKRATKQRTNKDEQLQNNGMTEEPLILPTEEKEKVEQSEQLPEQPKIGEKRKRNTIWCDVLQDQLISEDLEDCLLKNKPRHYGSRGKESYDYTRAYNDERRDSDSEMSSCSLNDDSGADSNSKSKKKNSFPAQKKFKKFVKLDSAELDASRKINKVLNEKKFYLIQRIVKYAGIEKAMKYLEQTKEIEENGGMMIKSLARRRTPGGVYLQMFKEDKELDQEIIDKVFEGEMSGYEMKKYFQERRKKKKKFNKNRKNSLKQNVEETCKSMAEVDSEPMEPDEAVVMDAEVATEVPAPLYQPASPLSTVPVIDKKSTENMSDLEEGEIE